MSIILTKYHQFVIRLCLTLVLGTMGIHYVADAVFLMQDEMHEHVDALPVEAETSEEKDTEEQSSELTHLKDNTDPFGKDKFSDLTHYTQPVLSYPCPPPDLA